eukprot:jgi/Ulvmu1/9688/UM055_0026.1
MKANAAAVRTTRLLFATSIIVIIVFMLKGILFFRSQRHLASAGRVSRPARILDVPPSSFRVRRHQTRLASIQAAPLKASRGSDAATDSALTASAVKETDMANAIANTNYSATFPPEATVFMTFVNGDEKYRELMINWALHLRALSLFHIVVAFDDQAAQTCQDNGIPHLRHDADLGTQDFRSDFESFRKMGSNKPLIVHHLLGSRAAAAAVVLSDVDTVWLRDPSDFIARFPSADAFISTDCLSHWVEAHAADSHAHHSAAPVHYHRCGHLPGATFGRAFNTGVIIFRNRPATLSILREWRALLTDPRKAYAPSARPGGVFAITDQLALNILLERGMLPVAPAAAGSSSAGDGGGSSGWTSSSRGGGAEWRVIAAANGTLALMPLPALLFTNGHVFFYQHLPQLHGVTAYVVHATFQRHHTPGKRARLREEGLWKADPPGYFAAHRLLAYRSGAREYIDALAAAAAAPMPPLLRHFHAMAFQLAQMRDAFALARALNRTLVLPRFLCYCDQDWYASVLKGCRVDGSDLAQPFVCPLDVLLNPGALDAARLPYRMESYLRDPRTPAAVVQSEERVHMHAGGAWVEAARRRGTGGGGVVAVGASGEVVRDALVDVEGVHVLRVEGLRPGGFGGWAAADANAEFDREWMRALGDEAKWCCSGEQPIDVRWITWPYLKPADLAEHPPSDWDIPQFRVPLHCEAIADGKAGKLNVEFLAEANHPCTFLNATYGLPLKLSQLVPEPAGMELLAP